MLKKIIVYNLNLKFNIFFIVWKKFYERTLSSLDPNLN